MYHFYKIPQEDQFKATSKSPTLTFRRKMNHGEKAHLFFPAALHSSLMTDTFTVLTCGDLLTDLYTIPDSECLESNNGCVSVSHALNWGPGTWQVPNSYSALGLMGATLPPSFLRAAFMSLFLRL